MLVKGVVRRDCNQQVSNYFAAVVGNTQVLRPTCRNMKYVEYFSANFFIVHWRKELGTALHHGHHYLFPLLLARLTTVPCLYCDEH